MSKKRIVRKPRKITVTLTENQYEVVRRITKRLRCTEGDYLRAAAMSEIEGWKSEPELWQAAITALVEFVEHQRTPECALG